VELFLEVEGGEIQSDDRPVCVQCAMLGAIAAKVGVTADDLPAGKT
jgi:hypothetical protein